MYAKLKPTTANASKQRIIQSTSSGVISPNDTGVDNKLLLSSLVSPKENLKMPKKVTLITSFQGQHHQVKSNPPLNSPRKPPKEPINQAKKQEGSINRKSLQNSKAKIVTSKSPAAQDYPGRKSGGAASALALRHSSPSMTPSILAAHKIVSIKPEKNLVNKAPQEKQVIKLSKESERIKTPIPPKIEKKTNLINNKTGGNQSGSAKQIPKSQKNKPHLLSGSEIPDASEPKTARVFSPKPAVKLIKAPTKKQREMSFGGKDDKKIEIKNVLSLSNIATQKQQSNRVIPSSQRNL